MEQKPSLEASNCSASKEQF